MSNTPMMSPARSPLARLLPLGVALVVCLVLFSCGKGQYNDMVKLEEDVETAWSQVENQYQRRMDLIPNLVSAVKGYAAHEKEVLEEVAKARSQASSVSLSLADEASVRTFQAAQHNISGALSRLMAVSERYPELQSSEAFRTLQAQLEGTENRISVERKRYNEVVKQYNQSIRSFPAVIFASLAGYGPKPYFTADKGAEKAPKVDFGG